MRPNRIDNNGHPDIEVVLETNYEQSLVLGALSRKLLAKMRDSSISEVKRSKVATRLSQIVPALNIANTSLVGDHSQCKEFTLTPSEAECVVPFLHTEPSASTAQHQMAVNVSKAIATGYAELFNNDDPDRPMVVDTHLSGVEHVSRNQ